MLEYITKSPQGDVVCIEKRSSHEDTMFYYDEHVVFNEKLIQFMRGQIIAIPVKPSIVFSDDSITYIYTYGFNTILLEEKCTLSTVPSSI